eukprot:7389023-Prymnesium_polylepis.1
MRGCESRTCALAKRARLAPPLEAARDRARGLRCRGRQALSRVAGKAGCGTHLCAIWARSNLRCSARIAPHCARLR